MHQYEIDLKNPRVDFKNLPVIWTLTVKQATCLLSCLTSSLPKSWRSLTGALKEGLGGVEGILLLIWRLNHKALAATSERCHVSYIREKDDFLKPLDVLLYAKQRCEKQYDHHDPHHGFTQLDDKNKTVPFKTQDVVCRICIPYHFLLDVSNTVLLFESETQKSNA